MSFVPVEVCGGLVDVAETNDPKGLFLSCLLGHDSSKTTEVNPHITTKGFDQIKSPLDKLNIN